MAAQIAAGQALADIMRRGAPEGRCAMSRTPEETARLAATVTVETIYGDVGISAEVAMGAARARFHGSDHPRLHALACLAADLAETRAEVATLRGHVKLLAEWQETKRAELATPAPPDGDCSAWIKSLQGTSSVESRMLAAELGAAFAPVQDTGALACP